MINKRVVRIFQLFVLVLAVIPLGLGWRDGTASARAVLEVEPGNRAAPIPPNPVSSFPAYDSGWYEVGPRPDPLPIPFSHGLGGDPDDYLVSLTCRDDTSLATYDCTNFGFTPDAEWSELTDSSITVWVKASPHPDAVRVRIYLVSADYDSGWFVLLARPDPIPVSFAHNVGGFLTDYRISLECRDDTSLAIYNCTDSQFINNAFWFGLTQTTITVWVSNGQRPDEIRVRVIYDPPDYDSGWVNLSSRPDPLPVLFDHAVAGDPEAYEVSLICQDDSSLAIHDCTDFFFLRNAGWYGLTDTEIDAWVDGGSLPDDVRVRIWSPAYIYLPVITKN